MDGRQLANLRGGAVGLICEIADYVGSTCGHALTSGMLAVKHTKEYLGE